MLKYFPHVTPNLSNRVTSATCLVYDAIDLPLFHRLLDVLSRLHHRLGDLLGGTGRKAEDVIFVEEEESVGE